MGYLSLLRLRLTTRSKAVEIVAKAAVEAAVEGVAEVVAKEIVMQLVREHVDIIAMALVQVHIIQAAQLVRINALAHVSIQANVIIAQIFAKIVVKVRAVVLVHPPQKVKTL